MQPDKGHAYGFLYRRRWRIILVNDEMSGCGRRKSTYIWFPDSFCVYTLIVAILTVPCRLWYCMGVAFNCGVRPPSPAARNNSGEGVRVVLWLFFLPDSRYRRRVCVLHRVNCFIVCFHPLANSCRLK